jgi:hypothetical protein
MPISLLQLSKCPSCAESDNAFYAEEFMHKGAVADLALLSRRGLVQIRQAISAAKVGSPAPQTDISPKVPGWHHALAQGEQRQQANS